MAQPIAETRSSIIAIPVNNIVDNLTWTKGNHTFGGGGNWRLIHNNRGSDETSFNSATTNPYWLGGSPPDPGSLPGLPTYSGGFSDSYLIAYANLVGTVPQTTSVSNYSVSGNSGSLLPDGTFINRKFRANEYRVVYPGFLACAAKPDRHLRSAANDSADALREPPARRLRRLSTPMPGSGNGTRRPRWVRFTSQIWNSRPLGKRTTHPVCGRNKKPTSRPASLSRIHLMPRPQSGGGGACTTTTTAKAS